MYKDICPVEKPRVLCLDDWKKFGVRTIESFERLENAYKTLQNNIEEMKAVEKVYKNPKIQKMVKQACLNGSQSKIKMPKSDARVKAGKKKAAHLKIWKDCVKAVSMQTGTAGIPKKGTPFYEECKRLMKEKLSR